MQTIFTNLRRFNDITTQLRIDISIYEAKDVELFSYSYGTQLFARRVPTNYKLPTAKRIQANVYCVSNTIDHDMVTFLNFFRPPEPRSFLTFQALILFSTVIEGFDGA